MDRKKKRIENKIVVPTSEGKRKGALGGVREREWENLFETSNRRWSIKMKELRKRWKRMNLKFQTKEKGKSFVHVLFGGVGSQCVTHATRKDNIRAKR